MQTDELDDAMESHRKAVKADNFNLDAINNMCCLYE